MHDRKCRRSGAACGDPPEAVEAVEVIAAGGVKGLIEAIEVIEVIGVWRPRSLKKPPHRSKT